MAVLNKIRKQSLVLIAVIALALFSFVLADLFRNSDALTSKSQNVVATINGKDISREDFLLKVDNLQRRQGSNVTNTQAMNNVWDQEVRKMVMESQFDAIGFTVERDQMKDLLKTGLATTPDFQNEAGIFDENKLNEFIANLKALSPQAGVLGGQPITYQNWVDYENSISSNALQVNYNNMVKAGMIGTLAEGELEHKLEAAKVDVRFVQIPYSSIQDSTITVSKSEITAYINAHKKDYEVEETRDLNYVQFNEVASIDDENAIKDKLAKLLIDRVEYNESTGATDSLVGFSKVVNNEVFINANSDIKYNNSFVAKSVLPVTEADSIFNLNIGETYGPYKHDNHFKITKMIAVRQMPDSVKARHILIPFIGATGAKPDVTHTEEQAKKIADSVLAIVESDRSKFADLVTSLSSDEGSIVNGGRYDWYPYNKMTPEFRDFTFENNTGDMSVVKTAYGFHIIEIEGQKNYQRNVQVGTIAILIEPSETTIDNVFRDVSNFEIAVNKGDFQALAEENNYIVRPVNGMKALDENIPGLGNQRAIVRWSFDELNEVGDIKRFDISNGGFAIVQLTAKNKEGLMNTENASVTALPAIRKEKKAQLIRARVSATTIDELATAESQTVKTASSINMKNPTVSGAGNEPLMVGTAFGLNEGETSKLIDGVNGVYMVEVTKVTVANQLDNYQSFANQVGTTKINAVNTRLYTALKEAAKIEDNRAKTVQ